MSPKASGRPGAIVVDLIALGNQLGQAVQRPLIIVSNIEILDETAIRLRGMMPKR